MPYDITSIRRTTETGIPNLADKIFAGVVDEGQAMSALFMGLRPKLTKELEKRRADEVLWLAASECKDLKQLKDYVETYDNEVPDYIGRHLDEAKKLIEFIGNDDKEWYAAKLKNTVDSYKYYLDLYDNPAPSYKGKFVEQAKEAIKIVKDKEDWAKAKDENSITGYANYLLIYDKQVPDYVGIYVNDAKQAIKILEDEADWHYAININTIDSYRGYLSKYDTNPPAYKGRYVDEAQQRIEELLPPPPPNPRIADDGAWAKAVESNTIEAYNEYLREYDIQDSTSYKGVHVKDAKLAILKLQDDKDWDIASIKHTLDSYNGYLSKYSSISGYVGRHIQEAQRLIIELTPPDSTIEDNNAWIEATRVNTVDGYRKYLSIYELHANEAELAIRHLIDEKAWTEAKKDGTIASYKKYLSICEVNDYPGYTWVHINAAKTQIGNLNKAEENKRREAEHQRLIAEDNSAWDIACKANIKQSYETYLSKYKQANGLHVREAEYAILRLQEEDDWRVACSENSLDSYKRFVNKYEAMSRRYSPNHLSQAKENIAGLTPPNPDPNPNKWIKGLTQVILFIICFCGFYQLRHHHIWPFNKQQHTVIEPVDSLQWAIDNHNIAILERYAEMDSIRAFYPLSLELWSQRKDTLNSLINIRKALGTINPSSPLYGNYTEQLESLKNIIGFYETIGHQMPPMPSFPGDRLQILAKEVSIIKRAKYISRKYDFTYTPDTTLLKYIDDDFRRWVLTARNSPVKSTKEDCYKAALQLKEDKGIRQELNKLAKEN